MDKENRKLSFETKLGIGFTCFVLIVGGVMLVVQIPDAIRWVVSFIRQIPSQTWGNVIAWLKEAAGKEAKGLSKEFLSVLLVGIPYLFFIAGLWWTGLWSIRGEASSIFKLRLCEKCSEQNKYLLRRARQITTRVQVMVFLILLILAGFILLLCLRWWPNFGDI